MGKDHAGARLTLQGTAAHPNENRAGGNCAPDIRLIKTHVIDSAYEKLVAPVNRAIIVFSAAELPILINAMMTRIDKLKRIELSGIGVPMTTTFRNQLENGSAWSRASAQACRDAAARALREVQTERMMGMQVMHTVPALLPVPARKTSTKGKGDSELTTASMFVMQKHCQMDYQRCSKWLEVRRARLRR